MPQLPSTDERRVSQGIRGQRRVTIAMDMADTLSSSHITGARTKNDDEVERAGAGAGAGGASGNHWNRGDGMADPEQDRTNEHDQPLLQNLRIEIIFDQVTKVATICRTPPCQLLHPDPSSPTTHFHQSFTMASANKLVTAPSARRKSSKSSMIVTLKLPPQALQQFDPNPIKEESPSKESPSSSVSNTLPIAPSSNGDVKSESTSNTPVPVDTPVPTSMPPPTEGVKKKGVKRSAAVALGPDGLPIPKVRGKPGPKKKARLEDGSIDHSSTAPRAANASAAHKLGPKANQGAINAGLRALDRTGKPCRKWQKGGFKLKSFTGVIWEIPRWKAPPKISLEGTSEGSASGDSSKENKDSQIESEKSNSGLDVEMASSPAPSNPTSSAPPVVAASA
ncbi:hypothetical protein G7Y89_g2382 [Cudoniella acicularis]|uniref:DUF1711 domain-containing protein n=1 Tax=Cudoniella acicularis TaxID=354080 RepID=A0A8H4W9E5_9HELO|nr:hypothetical protein G7Y89_g2382 [Cudoniella acicularis]